MYHIGNTNTTFKSISIYQAICTAPSEHGAVVQWIRRVTENRLSAAGVGSNPNFCALDFFVLDV